MSSPPSPTVLTPSRSVTARVSTHTTDPRTPTGSSEALKGLLKFNAIEAFLFAISNFKPQDPPALRSAFARALRALAVAVADAVGPSQGGLQIHPSDAREEATVALNSLFEVLCALSPPLPS